MLLGRDFARQIHCDEQVMAPLLPIGEHALIGRALRAVDPGVSNVLRPVDDLRGAHTRVSDVIYHLITSGCSRFIKRVSYCLP